MEESVVKRLSPHFRGLYIYPQIGHDLTLTGEIFQLVGPDNSF